MNDRARRLSRRNFLLAAGAGTAATAAAMVATKQSSAPADKTEDKRATRGYHASEHVTNYYRTTKV